MRLIRAWRRFKVRFHIGHWWVDVQRANERIGYRWDGHDWVPAEGRIAAMPENRWYWAVFRDDGELVTQWFDHVEDAQKMIERDVFDRSEYRVHGVWRNDDD